MDIKELNKKLQFEFSNKHYLAIKKSEQLLDNLKAIPAYQKLCKLEKDLVFEVASPKTDKKTKAELEKNLKSVRSQKQKLFEKLGIKESDLVPKFECPLCQDRGFVGSTMCKCFVARRNSELLKLGGLGSKQERTFEKFDTKICAEKSQAENLEKLKNILQKWSSDYPKVKKTNLTISGNVGVGKTYLSECLANALAKRGYSVCFVSAFDMNNMFLKYHTTFDQSKQAQISPLIDSDFLFIDDLGTEPLLKNVTQNYLYLVLSERERHEKPVIITTNLLPENILDRYGERIFSRVANKITGKFFHISGNDLRINKN